MSDNYFLNNTSTEIVWHTQEILQHHDSPKPLVLINNTDSSTCIFIYTPDKANLFAHCVSILDYLCLNIIEARIITSKNGYSLDSFNVVNLEGQHDFFFKIYISKKHSYLCFGIFKNNFKPYKKIYIL